MTKEKRNFRLRTSGDKPDLRKKNIHLRVGVFLFSPFLLVGGTGPLRVSTRPLRLDPSDPQTSAPFSKGRHTCQWTIGVRPPGGVSRLSSHPRSLTPPRPTFFSSLTRHPVILLFRPRPQGQKRKEIFFFSFLFYVGPFSRYVSYSLWSITNETRPKRK